MADNSDNAVLLKSCLVICTAIARVCQQLYVLSIPLLPDHTVATYVNESLKHSSHIDYVLASITRSVLPISVSYIRTSIFSDHLPLMTKINTSIKPPASSDNQVQWQLHRDKADRGSYYYYTGECWLSFAAVNNISQANEPNDKFNDRVRDCIALVRVSCFVLNSAADNFVPKVKESFL